MAERHGVNCPALARGSASSRLDCLRCSRLPGVKPAVITRVALKSWQIKFHYDFCLARPSRAHCFASCFITALWRNKAQRIWVILVALQWQSSGITAAQFPRSCPSSRCHPLSSPVASTTAPSARCSSFLSEGGLRWQLEAPSSLQLQRP